MKDYLYSYEYDYITILANKVIHRYVKSYPLDMNVVMDSIKSIIFKTYSCADIEFRKKSLKMSDTAYSYQALDKRVVVYNDYVPQNCQTFSILHELGHLGQDHFTKRD
ncbi:MAG: ImmA/IrrE family metallo-endopeptidase, partial [Proteobacteria bacterium]|nr:ImmA/IrrE family metallo-endopeptidase [Pseudomonadota bacterium]